jgi:hypothetical protein
MTQVPLICELENHSSEVNQMDQPMTVGTLVHNPSKPEWGPGKAVHIHDALVHVVFRDSDDADARRFRAGHLVVAEQQQDDILDNLPPLVEKNGAFRLPGRRVSVEQARQKFLARYPAGFHDPSYLGDKKVGERNYKLRAHELWVELLGGGAAEELLAAGDIPELRARAVRVAGAVNLLAVVEAAAFREGLADDDAAAAFFAALLHLLDNGPAQSPFEAYADAVAQLPAQGATSTDKWTIATILPFLANPNQFMFVKPTITRRAAERLAFDLHYEAQPNWQTYAAVLRMSEAYKAHLADLGSRDYIDVQSFFWVTGDQYDRVATGQRKKQHS